jgi:flagellar hook assembly protein FlgD
MQSSFSAPRAYPNPFRGSVSISFEVPALSGAASQDVEIGVYDMRGNLVQRLAKGKYAAGSYAVSWNGRAAGSDVAGSGIYLVRVKANGVEKQMKLIEIK